MNIKYMECTRGGYHQGELLNIVCLNEQCKANSLCCCACVDESHNGHKTTTLKKLLIDAKQSASESQNQKQSVKGTSQFNNDIIDNLIESARKDALDGFKKTRLTIENALSGVQQQINAYFKCLEQTVKNQGKENSLATVLESIQIIQGASNTITMITALKQLLQGLQSLNKQKSQQQNKFSPTQDGLINLMTQSNNEISSMIEFNEAIGLLQKSLVNIHTARTNLKNIFEMDIFRFSSELKSPDVFIMSDSRTVSKKGQTYQVALLEPNISPTQNITAFKFKIIKSTSNWIAFGMCHKNIIVKNKFSFEYKTIGHGCYMISSNAGSWSHITEQLNNKVKAFRFNQGQTVVCIVNRQMRSIFFVKQSQSNLQATQRQVYELPFVYDPSDPLHPCVVYYFQNDEVECLPAINLDSIPKYDYLFSDTLRHPRLKVIDQRIVKAVEGVNEYRAVLLNKSLEENFDQVKKFSFKVLKSTNNWVAFGMCHAKTAANSAYGFSYQAAFHGYYMISSNGGSWSSIDPKKNNLVKAFKFNQGDVVDCQVKFGKDPVDPDNKIIFKKGIQTYELNFKGIAGDKLYPCVMLHFANDQVSIMPSF